MQRLVDENMVVNPKIAHYVLRVSNLKNSVEWYSHVLGMQVVYQNEQLCFMTNDDEHHRLALAQTPVNEQLPQGAPGLDHVAFTLADFDQLFANYKRLKAQDILPVWPINHGLTTSMYYSDPDGCRVEFQVENYASKDELNAYMRSDAFAQNPIGVTFDPEALLARYENGDPIEELIKLGSAP